MKEGYVHEGILLLFIIEMQMKKRVIKSHAIYCDCSYRYEFMYQ